MYFSLVPKGYRLLRKPEIFLEFYGRNFVKVASNKLLLKNVFLDRAKKRKSVIGHKFINNTEFNTYIKELLRGQNAFLCCRYGSTELKACFYAELCERSFTESVSDENLSGLKSASGVFPPREDVYLNFARIYKEAIAAADLNAYWGTILMEEYILKQQLKCDCILYAMRALEPFQYETPWTRELKGKKVVVVHPFSELIKSQYYARGGVFPEREIMPECDLRVVKAIQSSGDNYPEGFNDWEDALDSLYTECMKEDFEVALLSCGSYAVPLGARLKNSGKKVIVVGGMLQLMFGIKGQRWEKSRPDIVELYNDYWVRPGDEYKVSNSERMVDGAAYW